MRDWRTTAAAESARLTSLLRSCAGTQTLRPIQAAAFSDAEQYGGLFLGARVGAGKTLIASMLPVLWGQRGYRKPLILTSGSMVGETEAAFATARKDWQVCRFYDLQSYSKLSRAENADYLDRTRPDMIICDEADALRRLKDASVPRRLARYREAQPDCRFAFMSGTFHKDGLLDYAHMLAWSLGANSPIPYEPTELEQWSRAIDEGDGWGLRALAGKYGCPEDWQAAKAWYRERLHGWPGVVISDDFYAGSRVEIDVVHADPGLDEEYNRLRTYWERPDGWSLADQSQDEDADLAAAASVWSVAQQFSLGFYYSCDPPPPREWMRARRDYFRLVRASIEAEGFDTELQVRRACAESSKPPQEYLDWLAIKDTFEPTRVPVWLDDRALRFAEAWGNQSPGLIWCEHTAFAVELARRTGWAYYGPGGQCDKLHIRDARPDRTIILSRQANYRGRDLGPKGWNRNLVFAIRKTARDIEQQFGRTQRDGQPNAVVYFTLYLACLESANALACAFQGAEHGKDTFTGPPILLNATVRTHGGRPSSRAWDAK